MIKKVPALPVICSYLGPHPWIAGQIIYCMTVLIASRYT
jgi:hypothetical protein